MQKKDLQRLAEIYVKVYTVFDVGERWTVKQARKLCSYWLKRQPDLAFVAVIEGEVVGAFISSIISWNDGNRLADGELFVHPDYQKKGVGTRLCITLYKKALEKYDVTFFDAATFKNREFPLQWYLSQGFEVHKEWTLISGDVKKILSTLEAKARKS